MTAWTCKNNVFILFLCLNFCCRRVPGSLKVSTSQNPWAEIGLYGTPMVPYYFRILKLVISSSTKGTVMIMNVLLVHMACSLEITSMTKTRKRQWMFYQYIHGMILVITPLTKIKPCPYDNECFTSPWPDDCLSVPWWLCWPMSFCDRKIYGGDVWMRFVYMYTDCGIMALGAIHHWQNEIPAVTDIEFRNHFPCCGIQ